MIFFKFSVVVSYYRSNVYDTLLHWTTVATAYKDQIQWNSVISITNSVVNEQSVIKNLFLGQIGHFITQINSVITNPGFNEQKWPVPSCSL